MPTPERNQLPPELLAHPALWRLRGPGDPASARGAANAVLSTGHAALDACLPGGGWPRGSLVELLVDRPGIGELSLLLPALDALCRRDGEAGGWIAWIAPPHAPYAPALAARGIDLARMLVVHAPEPEWAIEQALASGACSAVLGWTCSDPARAARERARGPAARLASRLDRRLRRLQLAAERSGTLTVLFRPLAAAASASPAVLRIALEPAAATEAGACALRLRVLKCRGGAPLDLRLEWPLAAH